MPITTHLGLTMDNPYNDETVVVYREKNTYYFRHVLSGKQSEKYTVRLGQFGLTHFKNYRKRQTALFSGRKHLFLQELFGL